MLSGDLHAAGREVFDRLVTAAVAELQLKRFAAVRQTDDLMTEADAKHGLAFVHQRLRGFHGVVQRLRIARAIRKKIAVEITGLQLGKGRLRGKDLHVESGFVQQAQDVGLHAEVQHGHFEALARAIAKAVALFRGDG